MAYKFTIKGIRKFNEEKVVEKALVSYRGIDNDPEVKVMYHETLGEEKESYTVMTVNVSSQGVNIKHMIGGNIIVELPWLASQMDVRLCYAYLNAVKKVHRGARIMDEEDKGVKLTEAIPDFNWEEGHSGEILSDSQADKLEEVWKDYIERTHALATTATTYHINKQHSNMARAKGTRCTYYERFTTEEALQAAADSYGGLTTNDTYLNPKSR